MEIRFADVQIFTDVLNLYGLLGISLDKSDGLIQENIFFGSAAVTIGMDNGGVRIVPINEIDYDYPMVGDFVKVEETPGDVVVTKLDEASTASTQKNWDKTHDADSGPSVNDSLGNQQGAYGQQSTQNQQGTYSQQGAYNQQSPQNQQGTYSYDPQTGSYVYSQWGSQNQQGAYNQYGNSAYYQRYSK